MTGQIIFWILFILLWAIIIILDRKRDLLRDISTANPKPFSFARIQLAWWTVIILSSFIAIIIADDKNPNDKHRIPTFDHSALILLGISLATTATAAAIDASDRSNPIAQTPLNQDVKSTKRGFLGLWEDILSDRNGITISRFQTVIFHITFGCVFINYVIQRLGNIIDVNKIMPPIETNNLILLGLSTGAYAVLKTTENK